MSVPLTITIIEDEIAAFSRLKKELSKLDSISVVSLTYLSSIKEAFEWFNTNQKQDLIFMDIQLSDGLSFEIFKRVVITEPVIFVTAYDEYALQAFAVHGLDYLLKPISGTDLKRAIDRYLTQPTPSTPTEYTEQLRTLLEELKPKVYRSSFLISFKQKMFLVAIGDIAYFYIKERGTFLRRNDGKEYSVDFFLDDLENQLDPNLFFRANRQYLISRTSIREIEAYFTGRLVLVIEPDPPAPVLVSKDKAVDFRRWADF